MRKRKNKKGKKVNNKRVSKVTIKQKVEEKEDLEMKMKRKIQVMTLSIIIMFIWLVVKVLVLGKEYFVEAHNQFVDDHSVYFPFICGVLTYIMGCFVLNAINWKNRYYMIFCNVYYFPARLFFILVIYPFRHYIEPYLIPLAYIFGSFFLLFYIIFILGYGIFGSIIGEKIRLISLIAITLYTYVMAYEMNGIHSFYKKKYYDANFTEGKNVEEITKNFQLYMLGFANKKKIYEVSMRFFHQDNLKFLIHLFYFLAFCFSLIMKFGEFTFPNQFFDSGWGVILASFGLFKAIEKIKDKRHLWTTKKPT